MCCRAAEAGLRAFVLNTGGLHVFLCHHIRDDIVFVNVCASKYAARSESEASWTWCCKVLQEAGLSCYMRKGKIVISDRDKGLPAQRGVADIPRSVSLHMPRVRGRRRESLTTALG